MKLNLKTVIEMDAEPQDLDAERIEDLAAAIDKVITAKDLKAFMRKRLRVMRHIQLRFLGLNILPPPYRQLDSEEDP